MKQAPRNAFVSLLGVLMILGILGAGCSTAATAVPPSTVVTTRAPTVSTAAPFTVSPSRTRVPTSAPPGKPTLRVTDLPILSPTSAPTAPPTQNAVGLSAAETQTLVSKHNQWRARFNVPPLAWDETIAAWAQAWANQIAASGNLAHRQNDSYGENLWGTNAKTFALGAAVDDWGNEVNDYDAATNTCASGKVCGHFTQVVWRTSARLGCGRATAADGWTYIVCNYDPPGNFVGTSPFGN